MTTARYTGLSRLLKPEPLLHQVGGKQRDKQTRKLQEKVEDDAEPISTADEDSDDNSGPNFRKPSGTSALIRLPPADLSDESGSENANRGSMKRTAFTSSVAEKSRRTGTRNQSYSAARDDIADEFDGMASTRTKRRRMDDHDTSSRPSAFGQATRSKSPSSSNHHRDINGFVSIKNSKAKYGVGKKRGSAEGSQSKKVNGTTSSKPATFRAVDNFSSPQKPKRATLSAPKDLITSSPSKGERPIFKSGPDKEDGDADLLDSPKPKKPTITRLGSSQGSQSSIKTKRGGVWTRQQDLIEKNRREAALKPPEPKKERATFKMPADILDSVEERGGYPGSVDSPLSDLESVSDAPPNGTPASEASNAEEEEVDESITECPWCGDLVEKALLKDFSKGKRLNVRMQSKFCQKHKKVTAMDTWRSRHYPTVQWAKLEERFADHREFLLRVVSGEPSHFRNALAEKIESGTAARSLKKEDNLNPGYYGPRGFNIMCDYLVGEFGDLLKEKAVGDRVISGRGTPAFIQSVLVAELGVRMIQEDMDVSAKEAREIMEESKALGEMVHEEV
ncbi:Fc.00g068530.m01.CDS01 [Cosmosporella sp. VM-42]